MEYIVGRKPVLESFYGRRQVFKVLIAAEAKQSPVLDKIVEAAASAGVSVTRVAGGEIERAAGDVVHQGVAAEVSDFRCVSLDEVLEAAAGKDHSLVVLLDRLTDPQNLGAVVRTATAAGADGVVIPKHEASPVTPAVVKASAGATEHARIACANLNLAIDKLKEAGFWIVGAEAGAASAIWQVDLTGKIALVFGNEGWGLARLVKSKCDFLAKLPLAGPVESLNVSAAAAVMIYEVVRQSGERVRSEE